MERAQRLDAFWAWLPAFRAVAETEHLPTASQAFHVTPSALSRTVRMLEEELGRTLFERKGRQLRLGPAGHILLRAVRDAMRRVDEGLEELAASQERGSVRLTVPGPFAPLVVFPAMRSLPEVTPILRAHPGPEAVNRGLRTGAIDLAVLDDPEPATDLHIEPLMPLRHDVYCARASGLQNIDLQDLPFVAPLAVQGRRPDAWPVHRRRRVVLEVTVMQMAIDAVRAGSHVAVLPAVVAEAHGLVGLGVSGIPPTTLFLAHRPSLPGVEGRVERVAEALRQSACRSDS